MELNYKIEWTDDAIEELDNICDYLDFMSKSNFLSEKTVLKIYESIERLSSSPESCARIGIRDRYGHEYRRMVIGKYLVLYVINYKKNIVCISHIIDGRSNYLERLV